MEGGRRKSKVAILRACRNRDRRRLTIGISRGSMHLRGSQKCGPLPFGHEYRIAHAFPETARFEGAVTGSAPWHDERTASASSKAP